MQIPAVASVGISVGHGMAKRKLDAGGSRAGGIGAVVWHGDRRRRMDGVVQTYCAWSRGGGCSVAE
jgi:hypothetical protein